MSLRDFVVQVGVPTKSRSDIVAQGRGPSPITPRFIGAGGQGITDALVVALMNF